MEHLAHTHPDNDNHARNGARLVSTDGSLVPLRATHLEANAEGGIARTILTQTFVNDGASAIRVRYLVPLPADGAVSGFSFTIGEKRIVGEVDRKASARERFEQAISEGKAAAILDQERANTFTQEVGNIPAGATVLCEIVIDQPLAWLSEGAWEWRFPTVLGPRYLGAGVEDADKVTVPVSEGRLVTTSTLELTIGDPMVGDAASSSHALNQQGQDERTVCTLKKSARLDRDVVVRWPVAEAEVGVSLQVARPSDERHGGAAYALTTIVPPKRVAPTASVARDLIVLIDTSGSMGGQPLAQAKRVTQALVDSLADRDRLEMIEFSNRANRWRPEPVVATRNGKKAAGKWIRGLKASGGTEMRTGILEALSPLRAGAQRQVVLITDGYIGSEAELIGTVLDKLPPSCRVHTVGVGSAVNRALTRPVAAAGAGVELIIGLGEDVEPVVGRLLERTAKPVVTELSIFGPAVLDQSVVNLPDLYAGSPALIPISVDSEGGIVRITGVAADGPFEHEVEVPKQLLGSGNQGVVALFGREKVESLETRLAAGGDSSRINGEIEEVGLTFQISTRLTSWLAISDEVVSDGKPEQVEMPHELPYGTSAEGFGLRAPMAAQTMYTQAGALPPMSAPAPRSRMAPPAPSAPPGGMPFGGGGFADDDDFESRAEADAAAPEPVEEVVRSIRPQAPAKKKARSAPRPARDTLEMAKQEASEPVLAEPAPSARPEERPAPRKRPTPWLAYLVAMLVLALILYLIFGVIL